VKVDFKKSFTRKRFFQPCDNGLPVHVKFLLFLVNDLKFVMDSDNISDFHRQAMDLAEMAFTAKLRGNLQQTGELFRQAFEYERKAAKLSANDINAEPTRSVLHRSAASLAIDCGELREAERLIAIALSGNPPDEIADELRDLLEQVYANLNGEDDQLTFIEKDQPGQMPEDRISVKGQLLFANSISGRKGIIKLVGERGKTHRVIVPEGMMNNIVRPLWEDTVLVKGTRTSKGILLENIEKAVE